MTRPRVLVTRRWPEAVEAKMAQAFDLHLNTSDQPLSQADLRDAMGQYDAILPTGAAYWVKLAETAFG